MNVWKMAMDIQQGNKKLYDGKTGGPYPVSLLEDLIV